MGDNIPKGTPLPLCALRLLVPPIRLVSAAIWQTVQQKVVADYGMLEEFVSMVTDIVPELLTPCQRGQLILGLRARLILELCQFEATADFGLVQPHLDRMQTLIDAWVMEAGAANMKTPHLKFVDLVKNLLKNGDEREHFFQKVFPEEFGPTYDDALHTLMWLFLSRLEQFLPLQTFQQVSSMFGEVSSVLEECMDSVSRHEELKTLLQYQKDLSQLDHNDGSLDGTCIISALKLAIEERTETDKPQANILDDMLSCTSDSEKGSLTLSHDTTAEDRTSGINVDETNMTHGENGTGAHLGDITRHEKNAGFVGHQVETAPRLLKQCRVQLKRLDMTLPLRTRPARPNRGLRMKNIILEEKRGLCEAYKSASRKTKPSNRALSHISDNKESSSSSSKVASSYMAPINDSSDDSWSYYSDEDFCQNSAGSDLSMADSWSNYSGDESPFSVGSSAEGDSNEDPSFTGPKKVSAPSRKPGNSDIKAGTPKKTRKVQCFICSEPVSTSLRTHMRTHFPTGDYACPRCDSRFKLFSSLRLHLNRTCFEHCQQQVDPVKSDEAKNLFKCDECDEAFRYKVSLERHKRTHNELYCEVCRKVLRDAATSARHKASHTLFQCNRCEDTFTLFKPLLKHCENIHEIRRPFKCNYCPKVVSKLRTLIAHEWKHTGHLPFQCSLCHLRFKSDADLTSHERVHTKERPYLCAECGKTFSQSSNLLRHLNFIHSESRNKKKYSCSECEKSFKEKGALKKHQRTKHLRELFRHPCPDCGKMISASTIARHKLIHTGERPFKCTMPECDKCFRSAPEVKRHVLIHHTTERPYKCDVCGKGFIKLCYLNAHAKIHSGEKPFVCHFCGKAFPKRYSMQRHKKLVHTFVMH
ncbi:zinc finger protein 16-like isoform X2 [Anoplopoma fimbria]|uniref:zinc finger protein 16-like isoform X2 n=1 Tax=Anoplopoma fimbria TaxID=229290 RepID=UPI0023EAF93A|nr:zinc finger protein 16-like isoform X2 [Anoplopoma fimbria]